MKRVLEIGRPPARVFPWIEDPERQKRWMKGLEANEVVGGGPTRVGARTRMLIKEGGRRAEYDGEVTAYEPPRRLAIRMWGGALPKGMELHVDYRLHDLGGGRTRLEYEGWCDVHGFFMRLFAPLMKLFGGLQLRSFLKRLKLLAEAE